MTAEEKTAAMEKLVREDFDIRLTKAKKEKN